jgi:hypothetical protein
MPTDHPGMVTGYGPAALFWVVLVIAGVAVALWRPWRPR